MPPEHDPSSSDPERPHPSPNETIATDGPELPSQPPAARDPQPRRLLGTLSREGEWCELPSCEAVNRISASSATAFMRLYEDDAASHSSIAMDGATRIRDWLKRTLIEEGLTVEQWAALSGVHKSTIFRALKDNYEFVTSSRTLEKLASAVNREAPTILANVKLAPQFLPVRYWVQAGHWFEIEADEPPEQVALAVLPDPRFAQIPQWLEKVVGDSVDLKIPPGHYAHVVDAIEMGYAPQDGHWVVVERRRDQGAVRERSIKQVELSQGHVRLWPRSRNPKWKEPLDVTNGAKPGDTEVEIVGLVIGAYNADF